MTGVSRGWVSLVGSLIGSTFPRVSRVTNTRVYGLGPTKTRVTPVKNRHVETGSESCGVSEAKE